MKHSLFSHSQLTEIRAQELAGAEGRGTLGPQSQDPLLIAKLLHRQPELTFKGGKYFF